VTLRSLEGTIERVRRSLKRIDLRELSEPERAALLSACRELHGASHVIAETRGQFQRAMTDQARFETAVGLFQPEDTKGRERW
jgi:hypothetical protein